MDRRSFSPSAGRSEPTEVLRLQFRSHNVSVPAGNELIAFPHFATIEPRLIIRSVLQRITTMAEGKTILVVDDDQEMVDGLRIVLEKQGYRVITARDGQQGKQQVYHQRPDLMILDMMMPRMGGYPVLEHFKGKPEAR